MHFINENVPAKRDETVIWKKTPVPSKRARKRDLGFTNLGSSIELFYKVRSRLNEGLSYFTGMCFLHKNTPLNVRPDGKGEDWQSSDP